MSAILFRPQCVKMVNYERHIGRGQSFIFFSDFYVLSPSIMGNILAGHMPPYTDTWNTKVKDSNSKNNNNKTHTHTHTHHTTHTQTHTNPKNNYRVFQCYLWPVVFILMLTSVTSSNRLCPQMMCFIYITRCTWFLILHITKISFIIYQKCH